MANPAIDKAARYSARSIILAGEQQKDLACAAIRNAPVGIECLLREPVKIRKPDANKAMWAGPLKDIAEQAWYKGAQFSDVVWHDTYKRLFLPEEYDPELTKDGYVKWAFDRDGVKVLVGSTTQLTVKGFAIYLEKVYADGAQMGVQFSVNPNEGRR